MTQTVDTNVLVTASHSGSTFHHRAVSLLEHLAAGPALVHLLWPTVLGYLRIVTHPSILGSPLPHDQAAANIDTLLARPHVRTGGELDDFWRAYRRVADDARPRGNLVPDAHLVALMHQHGITTIWSHDRDLRKFTGITVKDPFSDAYADGFA